MLYNFSHGKKTKTFLVIDFVKEMNTSLFRFRSFLNLLYSWSEVNLYCIIFDTHISKLSK